MWWRGKRERDHKHENGEDLSIVNNGTLKIILICKNGPLLAMYYRVTLNACGFDGLPPLSSCHYLEPPNECKIVVLTFLYGEIKFIPTSYGMQN